MRLAHKKSLHKKRDIAILARALDLSVPAERSTRDLDGPDAVIYTREADLRTPARFTREPEGLK
jgi:hypothetical protein